MTRRSLLRRLLFTLGIVLARLVAPRSSGAAEADSGLVRAVLDSPSKTGTLSRAEMEDLVAFAEVLVEGRTLSPAERGHLSEHIEYRTKRDLSFYRTTARTLERLAGRRVSSLALSERNELIVRHRLAVSRVLPDEDLGLFSQEIRTLRTRAVPDLIGGYYGSPAGWAIVGYASFPGRCGDLARYTRAEG